MTQLSASATSATASESAQPLNVEAAVRERYSAAANEKEAALCCPVDYDAQFLEIIPDEIIQRDYGCGDPSKYVEPGDTVLDLGSGGGKICYIAAQVVGENGRVIGVDCTDDMLELARNYRPEIAARLGYDNVEFHKGKIQDLKLSLDQLDRHLADSPIQTSTDWLNVETHAQHLRDSSPMIADESVDVIVSNCVLNLVRDADRKQLFSEMHRVLRRGGRAVISDIVCDEDVPLELQNDPRLWSGCMSGAYREDAFLQAFEEAGFYGIEIVSRQEEPWAVVDGIEFRSLTVRAWKGKEGPCLERNQAVVYQGPWKAIIDDDGHRLDRGKRMAVCDKTFQIYTRAPYADQIIPVPPQEDIPLESAETFDCTRSAVRDPKQTKSAASVELTILPDSDCCAPGSCC